MKYANQHEAENRKSDTLVYSIYFKIEGYPLTIFLLENISTSPLNAKKSFIS
jgi:hypothetical protein